MSFKFLSVFRIQFDAEWKLAWMILNFLFLNKYNCFRIIEFFEITVKNFKGWPKSHTKIKIKIIVLDMLQVHVIFCGELTYEIEN